MGIRLLRGDVVFRDTAPFIYFFENNPRYRGYLKKLFDMIYESGAQIVTSMITYIEITAYPAKCGNKKLVAEYRDYLTNSENISLYPLNLSVSDEAVAFRAKHSLKTPDAIQPATAKTCGADYIITNDHQWKKITDTAVLKNR